MSCDFFSRSSIDQAQASIACEIGSKMTPSDKENSNGNWRCLVPDPASMYCVYILLHASNRTHTHKNIDTTWHNILELLVLCKHDIFTHIYAYDVYKTRRYITYVPMYACMQCMHVCKHMTVCFVLCCIVLCCVVLHCIIFALSLSLPSSPSVHRFQQPLGAQAMRLSRPALAGGLTLRIVGQAWLCPSLPRTI